MENVSKVVIDEGIIKGESEPLLIYEDSSEVAASSD
jgi:ATP-dependent Clp protease ATP-binding subunit ClpX